MSNNTVIRFEKSASIVKHLSKQPSNDEMGELYGLYKQSKFGNCNIPRPLLSPIEKAKWDNWNKFKDVKSDVAMNKYSDLVMLLINKYGVKN